MGIKEMPLSCVNKWMRGQLLKAKKEQRRLKRRNRQLLEELTYLIKDRYE